MENCTPATIPMQVGLTLPKLESIPDDCSNIPYCQTIGKLLYVAIASRPDILFAVNYLSRFVTGYNQDHWNDIKQEVCYLKRTQTQGIQYNCNGSSPRHHINPIGYCDADWVSDPITRKSVLLQSTMWTVQ